MITVDLLHYLALDWNWHCHITKLNYYYDFYTCSKVSIAYV